MKITTPATLTGISTKVDGSLSVRFATQELTSDKKLALIELQNQFGYICFAPSEAEAADIPETQPDDTRKTQSQRLRAVLFLLYKQGERLDDFDFYYREKMEKFIEHIKSKLND